MKKVRNKSSRLSVWIMFGVGVVVVTLVTVIAVLLLRPTKVVNTFEQCKTAGGAILETYPEQCTIGGRSFTALQPPVSGDRYVGLTEEAALQKARQDNVSARVVERDGESLPVTMDFAFGRNNLHVKDGKVYKVDVEGLATDN